MLCKGFSVVPHGFYTGLESFLNWGALPVPLLRQVFLKALKAWQALCFRDIYGEKGSQVRGSV